MKMTPIFCFRLRNDSRFSSAVIYSRWSELEQRVLLQLVAKHRDAKGGFSYPVESIEAAWNYVMPRFFRCGGCDHLHWFGWTGDCRTDYMRFSDSDLEERYGVEGTGWLEVHEETGEHVGLYSEGVYKTTEG